MNQKKISGIGNYLRSEILYDAKINPFITIGKLNSNKIKDLFKSIVKISKKSFNSQNVILKDEKNYTDEFEFKVYQQDKTPKGEKVYRKVIKGRSVFYVKSNWVDSDKLTSNLDGSSITVKDSYDNFSEVPVIDTVNEHSFNFLTIDEYFISTVLEFV